MAPLCSAQRFRYCSTLNLYYNQIELQDILLERSGNITCLKFRNQAPPKLFTFLNLLHLPSVADLSPVSSKYLQMHQSIPLDFTIPKLGRNIICNPLDVLIGISTSKLSLLQVAKFQSYMSVKLTFKILTHAYHPASKQHKCRTYHKLRPRLKHGCS